jgi:uncharacterized protein involved in response to NO
MIRRSWMTGISIETTLELWASSLRAVKARMAPLFTQERAFVPLGFLLASAAAIDIVVTSAGVHAWTVGAAGTMTLAVMTRASLGHTGNALSASPMTQTIYAAVVLAALARICASLEPGWSDALLHVTAFAWCIAFFGFALSFGPMLVGRQPATQPTL